MQPGRTATAFQEAFNRGDFAVALSMVDSSELTPSERSRFEEAFRPVPGCEIDTTPVIGKQSSGIAYFHDCEPIGASVVTVGQQDWRYWFSGRCEGRLSYWVRNRDVIFTSTTEYEFNFVARGSRIVVTEFIPTGVCEASS